MTGNGWERFSYYGMRALLIYYLTSSVAKGGLGFNDSKAGAVYGLYTAMAYLMCLAGGWIADLFIGQRRAVLVGGILITAGEFCLMSPSVSVFYTALVLLMTGTGFLERERQHYRGSNFYGKDDHRRDAGFSIFYMGINIGALISPIFCGYVGEHFSAWRLGFGLCAIGMLAGLAQYILTGYYSREEAGLHPSSIGRCGGKDRRQRRTAVVSISAGIGALLLIALLAAAGVVRLDTDIISNALGWCLLGISALVFAWLIFFGRMVAGRGKRSAAILVLFISSAVFWAGVRTGWVAANDPVRRTQHQTGMCPALSRRFWRQNEFPGQSWYQFVQPLFVVALAPVFCVALAADGKARTLQPGKILGRTFLCQRIVCRHGSGSDDCFPETGWPARCG